MRRGWKENNENEKVQDEELATEEESQKIDISILPTQYFLKKKKSGSLRYP